MVLETKIKPLNKSAFTVKGELHNKKKVRLEGVNESYEVDFKGVDDTEDFVNLWFSVWEGVNKAYEDNELTYFDILHMKTAFLNLIETISGIGNMLPELKDLSLSEKEDLLSLADNYYLGSYYHKAVNTLDTLLGLVRTGNAWSE